MLRIASACVEICGTVHIIYYVTLCYRQKAVLSFYHMCLHVLAVQSPSKMCSGKKGPDSDVLIECPVSKVSCFFSLSVQFVSVKTDFLSWYVPFQANIFG